MGMFSAFKDREDAGEQLAEALREEGVEADIVLAIPRGGLPLGRAVADALDVPLDIVVAKKIGAPGNPEYAIGAVASDGSTWRNESAIQQTGSTDEYFQKQAEKKMKEAQQKARRYRGDKLDVTISGRSVVVVDDGVATGSTVRACLSKLQKLDPERLILAVPVGSPRTVAELEEIADEVICLESPERFRAVGQAYEHFTQVSDTDAIAYLEDTG